MREYWLAAAAVVAGLAGAVPAEAQRVRDNGRWVSMPPRSTPMVARTSGHRWPMVNGRWSAGWQAPGGWNAYRRLGRGSMLPGFWMGHRVPDYLSFGLAAPLQGYGWVRYYDDAVLVDGDGRVWDSVGGIGWGGSGSFSSSHSYSNARVGTSYREPIQPVDLGYAPPPPSLDYDRGYEDQYQDDRGYDDRGYDDRSYDDRGYDRDAPIPYPAPYPGTTAPPVVHYAAPGCVQACSGGYRTGYYGGGYGYAAGGTTTIIINPAPIVTTTTVTEEIIEERVTTSYVRRSPKRVLRKYRPRARCAC